MGHGEKTDLKLILSTLYFTKDFINIVLKGVGSRRERGSIVEVKGRGWESQEWKINKDWKWKCFI